eukprot:SAG11_NODE_10636_length_815_cov_1.372905_1_plen_52_part_10
MPIGFVQHLVRRNQSVESLTQFSELRSAWTQDGTFYRYEREVVPAAAAAAPA